MNSHKTVESFDRGAFLSNLEGMEEIALVAIQSFMEGIPKLISTLSEAIDNKDAASIRIAAHTLKGVVSNFQAERSRNLAFEIEKMGVSGNIAEAPEALRNLSNELSILIRDLNETAQEMKK